MAYDIRVFPEHRILVRRRIKKDEPEKEKDKDKDKGSSKSSSSKSKKKPSSSSRSHHRDHGGREMERQAEGQWPAAFSTATGYPIPHVVYPRPGTPFISPPFVHENIASGAVFPSYHDPGFGLDHQTMKGPPGGSGGAEAGAPPTSPLPWSEPMFIPVPGAVPPFSFWNAVPFKNIFAQKRSPPEYKWVQPNPNFLSDYRYIKAPVVEGSGGGGGGGGVGTPVLDSAELRNFEETGGITEQGPGVIEAAEQMPVHTPNHVSTHSSAHDYPFGQPDNETGNGNGNGNADGGPDGGTFVADAFFPDLGDCHIGNGGNIQDITPELDAAGITETPDVDTNGNTQPARDGHHACKQSAHSKSRHGGSRSSGSNRSGRGRPQNQNQQIQHNSHSDNDHHQDRCNNDDELSAHTFTSEQDEMIDLLRNVNKRSWEYIGKTLHIKKELVRKRYRYRNQDRERDTGSDILALGKGGDHDRDRYRDICDDDDHSFWKRNGGRSRNQSAKKSQAQAQVQSQRKRYTSPPSLASRKFRASNILQVDDLFDERTITSLKQILSSDEDTKWPRIASQLKDETGLDISPLQLAQKVMSRGRGGSVDDHYDYRGRDFDLYC